MISLISSFISLSLFFLYMIVGFYLLLFCLLFLKFSTTILICSSYFFCNSERYSRKFPRTFSPEYRNPCWLDDAHALSVSAVFLRHRECRSAAPLTCGTRLGFHPEIVKTPKEPHWWGPRRTGYDGTAVNGPEGRYLNFHIFSHKIQ